VPVCVQEPPAQVVEPVLVVVLPRTPVNELVWPQVPPAHPPEPLDDQLPRGPDPPPDRVQASALEAPAAMTIAAIAAAPRYVLIESMSLLLVLTAPHGVSRTSLRSFARALQEEMPSVTICIRAIAYLAASRRLF
jgi:hypothetical protein